MRPGPFFTFHALTFCTDWSLKFPNQTRDSSIWYFIPKTMPDGRMRGWPTWWAQQGIWYVTMKTSTVWLRVSPSTVGLALDVVLIPVRREPPVESSAQDSASDSCSEKWCVQQRNCPPCYPACSPSCPRLSIPRLTSFTFTSHMWPQVKRHNLSLQDINKKGREVRGKRLDS